LSIGETSRTEKAAIETYMYALLVAVSMKIRLRVLRAEEEWSQAELAAHVGVARGTINAIETGKKSKSQGRRNLGATVSGYESSR
jgi:ribosome-binding protein aMBF1 (putative translation factor)